MRKTESLVINNPVLLNEHDDEADILYVGFISTKGAIEEGAERLEQQGVKSEYDAYSTITSVP